MNFKFLLTIALSILVFTTEANARRMDNDDPDQGYPSQGGGSTGGSTTQPTAPTQTNQNSTCQLRYNNDGSAMWSYVYFNVYYQSFAFLRYSCSNGALITVFRYASSDAYWQQFPGYVLTTTGAAVQNGTYRFQNGALIRF